jgi:hypothetical protein
MTTFDTLKYIGMHFCTVHVNVNKRVNTSPIVDLNLQYIYVAKQLFLKENRVKVRQFVLWTPVINR